MTQEKSDLIQQVIADADKMMARDAEVERLRDALRLFLRIDRMGDAVWTSPAGRAEALAMFDEFGASNWPDMRGIAIGNARAALGEAFDLRAFHAAVLENGYVPLWAVGESVDRYIASAQR
jgi:hypothetical protein